MTLPRALPLLVLVPPALQRLGGLAPLALRWIAAADRAVFLRHCGDTPATAFDRSPSRQQADRQRCKDQQEKHQALCSSGCPRSRFVNNW